MKTILIISLLIISIPAISQCDILNHLLPDGTMYYYMEPTVFYWTKKKELRGGIVTDKENYFIALQPIPFPEKPKGRKLNADLELKLSNNNIYRLKHFDTQYMDKDTIMQLLYIIEERDVKDLMSYEAIEAKIDMKGEEGIRTYTFKLHKNAIQQQLDCFLKEKTEKN
ncbi:MAG: hypothetical protein U0W24_09565 [Bacteroidales bacterium]